MYFVYDLRINNYNNAIKYAGLLSYRVNSSRLRWSPTAQSTGMLFSSWASWAAGNWLRRPGMFEHLRFCFNGFPLWCNDLIPFCLTMVLLTIGGFWNFWIFESPVVYPS